MRDIEVMTPGSPCWVGLAGGRDDDKSIPGTILQVCIADKCRVTYQVAWWDGRTRRCEWLDQIEVERQSAAIPVRVGFQFERGIVTKCDRAT